jgi:hypothetical protein
MQIGAAWNLTCCWSCISRILNADYPKKTIGRNVRALRQHFVGEDTTVALAEPRDRLRRQHRGSRRQAEQLFHMLLERVLAPSPLTATPNNNPGWLRTKRQG